MVRQFGRSITAVLQYVLPLVFVAGAATSLARRRRDAALLCDAAIDPAASIHALSWQDFERLIGASFEQQGFRVSHTGGGGADGGWISFSAKDAKRRSFNANNGRAEGGVQRCASSTGDGGQGGRPWHRGQCR